MKAMVTYLVDGVVLIRRLKAHRVTCTVSGDGTGAVYLYDSRGRSVGVEVFRRLEHFARGVERRG